MSQPTEGTALAAAGTPIVLADGSTAQLVYTFQSLLLIEERYGSLDAAMAAMDTAAKSLPADGSPAPGGKMFAVIIDLIAAGLIGQAVPTPTGRVTVTPDTDRHTVAAVLSLAQFRAYIGAFAASLREAFGPGEAVAAQDAAPRETAEPSPGEPGGTSPLVAQGSTLHGSGL